jgi:hypothetical protein
VLATAGVETWRLVCLGGVFVDFAAIASALPQGIDMIATFPAEEAAVISRERATRGSASAALRWDVRGADRASARGELVCAPESERSLAITITLRERPATPAQPHRQWE